MVLADYKDDMTTCCRCSACKYVPLETLKNPDYVNVCPSISRYNYRAYSGGGRLGIGVALLEKQLDYNSPTLRDIVYNCQMCGACDVSCKYAMDMEVLDPMAEIRAELVKHGNAPSALEKTASCLKQKGTMIPQPAANRGAWAKNLNLKDYLKDQVEVVYFTGCRTSSDKSLWNIAQSIISLMRHVGTDVGIAYEESCCGGRVYQMGYQDEAITQAKKNMDAFKKAGVKTLVTGCAECYFAFKVLYDKFGVKGDLEVLHTSEYFSRLIRDGKLKPSKAVKMTVTYHDPCHLGRQGEPYIHWKGKRKPGQLIIFDPLKEFRRGNKGVYDAPRELLNSIPGLKPVEMYRNKEFAWCCGAGGGVKETNPDFASWTAAARINEAKETGASVVATACPGCENLLRAASKETSSGMKVYDIIELLAKSVL